VTDQAPLDYQSHRNARRSSRIGVVSLVLGASAAMMEFMLWQGVFASRDGSALVPLFAVGATIALAVVSAITGISGMSSKSQFAGIGTLLATIDLSALIVVGVYFVANLPKC
jgi:hypothetical protein